MSDSLEGKDQVLIFLYNNVFFPKRIVELDENLDYPQSQFFNLIEHTLKELLEKIPPLDLIKSLFARWARLQGKKYIQSKLLNEELISLPPNHSLPLFMEPQNGCVIIKRHANTQADTSISYFQVSAANKVVMSTENNLVSTYPQQVISVFERNLLESKSFSQILEHLVNIGSPESLAHSLRDKKLVVDLKDVCSPEIIVGWLMALLSGPKPPETQYKNIKKKYRDTVLNLKGTTFRRSGLWISIKTVLCLSLLDLQGLDKDPKLVYKVILLLIHIKIAKFIKSDSEMMLECMQKIAKRTYKLQQISDNSEIIYEIVLSARSFVQTKKDEISDMYKTSLLNYRVNLNQPNGRGQNKMIEIKEEISKYSKIYSGESNQLHINESIELKNNYERLSLDCKDSFKLHNFIQSLTSEKDLSLNDFENYVNYQSTQYDFSYDENDSLNLLKSLEKYIELSANYLNDPVKTSTRIITCLQIIIILDKIVVNRFPVLEHTTSLGILQDELIHLLLPRAKDYQAAFSVIRYIKMRNNENNPALTSHKLDDQLIIAEIVNQENNNIYPAWIEKIENSEEKSIELKKQEVLDKVKEFNQLIETSKHFKCICSEKKNINQEMRCEKHFYIDQANSLEVSIFERSLPKDERFYEILVYELTIPESIAVLRDSILVVLNQVMNLMFEGNSSRGVWRKLYCFKRYKSNYEPKFTLSSTYRRRSQSRFNKYLIIHEINPDNYIFDNGYNMRYSFEKKLVTPNYLKRPYEISALCNFKLGDDFINMQWAINSARHSENFVLSKLSTCPNSIPIKTFIKFGMFRVGPKLQLHNLLDVLETETLPFYEKSVIYLLCKTLWELGSTVEAGANEGPCHPEFQSLFRNQNYIERLLTVIKEIMIKNSCNWVQNLIMMSLIVILQRCLTVNMRFDNDVVKNCINMIKDIKNILKIWDEKLKKLIESQKNLNEIINLRNSRFTINCLILYCFDIDSKYLHKLFETDQDIADWFSASCSLYDYELLYETDETWFKKFLMNLVRKTSFNCEDYIERRVLNQPRNPLGAFIDSKIPNISSNIRWIYESKHFYFWGSVQDIAEVKILKIGINGLFLLNDKPIQKLPKSITSNVLYKRYFQCHEFEISQSGRIRQSEPFKISNKKSLFYQFIEISKPPELKEELLIAECLSENNTIKSKFLIDHRIFFDYLPDYFIEQFSHWYNKDTTMIEFRTKVLNRNILNFNEVKLSLNISNGQIKDLKGKILMPLTSSIVENLFNNFFFRLELKKHIIILLNKDKYEIKLERYNLHFEYDETRRLVYSTEFKGFFIAQNQRINSLYGLEEGLILEEEVKVKSLVPKKKLIMPFSKIELSESKPHRNVKINLESLKEPRFFVYEIDERMKCIKADPSFESWLYLALLHSYTSAHVPDDLLGMFGVDRALNILRSGWCFSCFPYNEACLYILESLEGLSPIRKIYLDSERIMEEIKWPENLSSFNSLDCFSEIVENLKSDSCSMSALISESQNIDQSMIAKAEKIKLFRKKANKRIINIKYRCFAAVQKNPSLIQESLDLDSTTSKHIALISAGVSPGNLSYTNREDLSRDLNNSTKEIEFNLFIITILGDSEDITLMRLIKELMNHDEYFFKLVSSYLAFKRIDISLIALMFKAYQFRDDPEFIQMLQSNQIYDLNDTEYKEEPIKLILFENFNPETGNNFKKLNRNIGEPLVLFQQRVVAADIKAKGRILNHTEKFISKQWPRNNLDEFYNDLFLIDRVKSEVSELFKKWLNNKKWLEFMTNDKSNSHVLNFDFNPDQNPVKIINFEVCQTPETVIKPQLVFRGSPEYLQFLNELSRNIFEEGKIDQENSLQGRISSLLSRVVLEERKFPFSPDAEQSELKKYFIQDLSESWEIFQKSEQVSVKASNVPITELERKLTEYRKIIKNYENLMNSFHTSSEISYLVCSGIIPSLTPWTIQKIVLLNRSYNYETTSQDRTIFGSLCVLWTLEQRIIRCLRFHQDPLQAVALQRELECKPYENWTPKDYPEWVLLQLETDMMIRKVQVEVALNMINPPDQKNTVMQMSMGEGKTSLIIPMVILGLSKNELIVRVTVLKSIFNTNKKALVFKLGGILNKKIFAVPCKRDFKFDSARISFIEQVFLECSKGKGIILSQAEHRLSLNLKKIELIQNPQTLETGRQLFEVLNHYEPKIRDVLDESDEILDSKYQLVYTVGNQFQLDAGQLRWEMAQTIFELMVLNFHKLKLKFPDQQIIGELAERPKYAFPTLNIDNLKVYEELCGLICEDFLKCRSKILPFVDLRDDEKRTVQNFILSTQITLDQKKEVKSMLANYPTTFEQVLIMRGTFKCKLLFNAIQKRWRVNYGVDFVNKYLMQAVPFRAKDVPADRAQFAHPEIMILLTQLSYFYGGLPEEHMMQVLGLLKQDSNGEEEYSMWMADIKKYEEVDPEILELKIVNLEDPDLVQNKVLPLIKFYVPAINYWLNHFLYPKEAKQFKFKLVTSFWDLCPKNPLPMTGFSGTNDSKILLPLTTVHYDIPQLAGTNGSLIYRLLTMKGMSYSVFRRDLKDSHILQKISDENKDNRVIIDIGAVFIGFTNEQVATAWLKLHSTAVASIYFDENNDLVAIDHNGTKVPFNISPYRSQLDKCLVFLDDSHTRGTDFVFPPGTRGVVTLSKNITKDKLLQGCMRLRLLGQGHSVFFLATNEADLQITNAMSARVRIENILAWSLSNTVEETSENFFYWATQGISYYKRLAKYELFSKLVKTGISDDLFRDSEITDIDSIYGRNRKETPVSNILEFRINRALEELRRKNVQTGIFNDLVSEISSKVRTFLQGKNRFALMIDEEQEIELEIETEQDEEVHKRPVRKVIPENHSIERDVEFWAKTGRIPENSPVFQPLASVFGKTSVREIRQLDAWSNNIWVTLDFMRTVDMTCCGDDFLRPVKWLGYSSGQQANLVCLSGFEANELFNGLRFGPVKLFMFMPRSKFNQKHVLFNELNCFIPQRFLAEIAAFSGSQFFFNLEELQAYLKFIAYVPKERNSQEQVWFNQHKILPSGFVPHEFRLEIFGNDHSKFQQDPAQLILKIADIRNYAASSKYGHHYLILAKGRKPNFFNSILT